MYYASVLFKVGASDRQSFIWVWSIGGIILYSYMLLKYYVLIKALTKYINALRSKEFQVALTYGRVYYSVKRKGIFKGDDSGLTIYDEQAISNDIAAYSKNKAPRTHQGAVTNFPYIK